ncbi:hypothetical protein BDV29DRAFT_179276 [Aspergillus leporis]|uniref:Uncharacterized protein n=1 Tax=Aspergillus leporis TaxID=41062 RepID=A0A5N5WSG4_9EURO|nr:hypothetical protein BDV29DRAFT_179276 [Aspergillus leporis]
MSSSVINSMSHYITAPDDTMQSVSANVEIVGTAEAHGVRSYIFVPCLVYGYTRQRQRFQQSYFNPGCRHCESCDEASASVQGRLR